MRLYHGSNVTVIKPRLMDSGRTLDFGSGFYLTSDIDQAVRWARAVTFRRAEGRPIVNQYTIDDDSFLSLDRLEFNAHCHRLYGRAPRIEFSGVEAEYGHICNVAARLKSFGHGPAQPHLGTGGKSV